MRKDVRPEDLELLGRRVRVWWPSEGAWFTGVVDSFDLDRNKHLIKYDDGDQVRRRRRPHEYARVLVRARAPTSRQGVWGGAGRQAGGARPFPACRHRSPAPPLPIPRCPSSRAVWRPRR